MGPFSPSINARAPGERTKASFLAFPPRCWTKTAVEAKPSTRRISRTYNTLVELADGRVVTCDEEHDTDGPHPSWKLEEDKPSATSRGDLQVVLVHPQIPPNTGSIARTCAATCVPLHLVAPLGFDTSSKKLKRAGLDFWPYVIVKVHSSWEAFFSYFQSLDAPKRLVAFSKYGTVRYAEPDFEYRKGDWLLFGSETTGLPEEAHKAVRSSGGDTVKIPMEGTHVRCLNLSVSVGIGLYEAIRQLEYWPEG